MWVPDKNEWDQGLLGTDHYLKLILFMDQLDRR